MREIFYISEQKYFKFLLLTTGTMIEGLVITSGLAGGLPGDMVVALFSNTSLMLTSSPPLLESSSIRSSRVMGLLKMFLGPEI